MILNLHDNSNPITKVSINDKRLVKFNSKTIKLIIARQRDVQYYI